MKRSRAERRHLRERAIKRRMADLKQHGWYGYWVKHPGDMFGYRIHCTCPYCMDHKYYYRHKVMEDARREIDDALALG